MNTKLLIICLLISSAIFGQTPPGYTKINTRYDWLAGKFDSSLHIPGYATTPNYRTGAWVGAGNIGVDTVNNRLYFYSNGWKYSNASATGSSQTLREVISTDTLTQSSFTVNKFKGYLDTIATYKSLDTTGIYFAFPSLVRTKTGRLLNGFYRGLVSHGVGGTNGYRYSDNFGLTWSAHQLVDTTRANNYRNLQFGIMGGDTILATTWRENGSLWWRKSTDDGTTFSAATQITSGTDSLATEGKPIYWKGYWIIPVYKFNYLGTQSSGIFYSSNSGSTWTYSAIPNSNAKVLSEASVIGTDDSLIIFSRSDSYVDTLYRTSTNNIASIPNAAAVSCPYFYQGKPEAIRLADGRILLNYREDDGAVPTKGRVAISKNNGMSFDTLYATPDLLFEYGALEYVGDDYYINLYATEESSWAKMYQNYYKIPSQQVRIGTEEVKKPGSLLDNYYINRQISAATSTIVPGGSTNSIQTKVGTTFTGYSDFTYNGTVVSAPSITVPGTNTHSEEFGASAQADDHSVAVGNTAIANGGYNVVVGQGATANSFTFTTVVGQAAQAQATGAVVIGRNNSSAGTSVGSSNTSGDVNIGRSNNLTTGSNNIALGQYLTSTASNQLLLGSNLAGLFCNEVRFNGVNQSLANVYGPLQLFSLQASGSNVHGQDMEMRAGAGTGTGAGGYIGLFTAPAGSSGSSLNSYLDRLHITSSGQVGISNSSPDASAIVDITSTTQGLLPPRMTTTQKNAISSPAEGLMVYDLTLHKLYVYDGSTWQACW